MRIIKDYYFDIVANYFIVNYANHKSVMIQFTTSISDVYFVRG